jgi:alpha-galactosidase
MRKLAGERRRIADFYYGDYYPLTSYSKDLLSWLAWQFDRPDMGAGLVQAFRRSESPYESAALRLHSLDPDATYVVEDFDVDGTRECSGRELMDKGLPVALGSRASAAIMTYRKKGAGA